MSENEDRKARLDRELIELLNELRVALPGVQVLFAFLLIVPFSKGFPKLSQTGRVVFFAAVICTTLSAALLIAPTSYHRLRFRDHDKERLIESSNRMAIAGTALLALAMVCVVFLISDYVFNAWVAAISTALVACVFAGLWYVLPLSRPPSRRLTRPRR